ncbi:type I restriction enzyme HsdR N-terminal domain-containing protein, partial [Patescibacteria group bacterium]|nr:type I restriction enzyme HsdR N-terminal domain-containing protein [Patescibacteria group bacterium]
MTQYKKQKEKIITEPEKDKSGLIKDAISNEWIKKTPEEEVRQIYLQKLIKEYKYPQSHIKTEVKIQSGQTETKKRADIVVFKNDKNFRPEENAYIIIELKKRDRKDGEEQLKSYINSTTAEFAVWFNGQDIGHFQYSKDPRKHLEIPDIPKYSESLKDIGLYKKRDLVLASELKTVFETIHNHIYANEGYLKDKVFNEVLKLIFIKMIDEKSASADCDFRITVKEKEEIESGNGTNFRKRIESLFEKVKKDFSDIFDSTDKIILRTQTLAFAVGQLQKYSLIKTEADIKGVAFQTFVHAHSRGERGEFFTPYPILKMAVEMLSPKDNESILDPACGSGGFLVQTLNYIRRMFEKNRPDLSELEIIRNLTSYAINYIRGIDFNPDLARVAKMYMVLYDDGHTGIFSHNSLNSFQKIYDISNHKIKEESFDIVITNPPFGTKGKVTDKNILDNFEMGHKWKKDDDEWKRSSKIAAENGKGGQVP